MFELFGDNQVFPPLAAPSIFLAMTIHVLGSTRKLEAVIKVTYYCGLCQVKVNIEDGYLQLLVDGLCHPYAFFHDCRPKLIHATIFYPSAASICHEVMY